MDLSALILNIRAENLFITNSKQNISIKTFVWMGKLFGELFSWTWLFW